MRCGGGRGGRWRLALILAFLSIAPRAWADAGKVRADGLCDKAEKAERDARDAERKSAERQRFLKGKGGIDLRGDAFQSGDAAAIRQSVKAGIAQVRAILPQLRQGAAAATQDRGIVPGLGQYFAQMENNLSRTLQAADACLDAPRSCNVPSISCPPMPGMPVFNNSGSANLIRQIQQSYAQAAETARQACRNLNTEVLGDVERLKRESRSAGAMGGLPGSAPAQPFGETDLYLRRAENLRREASASRQEADRASGVGGYCGARSHSFLGEETAHALVEEFKTGGRRRKPEPGLRLDAKVIDLKEEWDGKWSQGRTLKASDVPLPKLSVGDGDESAAGRIKDFLKDAADQGGPEWWRRARSAYQEGDEEMGLTEFIRSRPKELAKDIVTEFVENHCPFGKTLTTGYKILTAVKTTADEVGGIVVDAPGVIAYGGEAEAKALAGRADRVPLNFMNGLFDDVTGKFPMPQFGRTGRAHE